jgi:amino-acid N-acetyltransferase
VSDDDLARLVRWFRQSSPYINAHRGRTFVVTFGGEALEDGGLPALVHDLALLNSLGVRLVVVPGARPQIERRLRERGAELRYVNGLRITDDQSLACVKEAVGTVRVELEALLSMGLANSPMAGRRLRVVSGNVVTARPLGVRDGVDYRHTGEVRRVDAAALGAHLDDGAVVLVSPLGYSPTGETFNLHAEEVAIAVARELRADKLLILQEADLPRDAQRRLIREMTTEEALRRLAQPVGQGDDPQRLLRGAVDACQGGVRRVHLLDRRVDGALLMELFTRDGIGTLVTARAFETIRQATVDDVGGILELIEPLERDGTLVRRSRERLETEIGHFTVMAREGTVVACAALYPMTDAAMAEIACFAVHPDYQGSGRGDLLLGELERQARRRGLESLFVLTTRTAHWFQERGFEPVAPSALPASRQELYNYRRNSRVFMRPVAEDAVS